MQTSLSVILPGGMPDKGGVQRRVDFKPLTGWIEQLIFSSRQEDGNLPLRISEILSCALHSIGNKTADFARVSALCVADRQFLMLCLARLISGDRYWLQGKCKQCSENFDVNIKQSELPVQEAGEGFPFVTLQLVNSTITLRIPSGNDQHAILGLSQHDAIKNLLSECIVSIKPETSHAKFIGALSEADLEEIDTALDRVSPSIGTVIKTKCPECQTSQVLELDPYHLIQQQPTGLYQDIHRIAGHYHWSEQEILSLPRTRRQLYLRLIDSTLGLHG